MGLRNLVKRVLGRQEPPPPPRPPPPIEGPPFAWEADLRFMHKHEEHQPGDHKLLLEAMEAPGYEKWPALASVVKRVQKRWEGWRHGVTYTMERPFPPVPPNWWENEDFITWHGREYLDPEVNSPLEVAKKIAEAPCIEQVYYREWKHVRRRYQGVLWRLETEGLRRCPVCGWLTPQGEDSTCGSVPCREMKERVFESVNRAAEEQK